MVRKNKIYLGLIGLGLVALGVDRFGVTSPSPSVASEEKEAGDNDEIKTPPRIPRAAAIPATDSKGVPELHFPRNLIALDPNSDIRDIFSRVADRHPKGRVRHAGPGTSGQQTELIEGIGREQFAAQHTLGALMVVDGLKIAVLNNHWLRIGDMMDTCTLMRIEGDCAIFQCHDGDAVISISPKKKAGPG